jgi:hypothetical protein
MKDALWRREVLKNLPSKVMIENSASCTFFRVRGGVDGYESNFAKVGVKRRENINLGYCETLR